jgi:hypothetical protein
VYAVAFYVLIKSAFVGKKSFVLQIHLNKSKYCTFKKFCRHHFLSRVKSGGYLVGLWNNSGKLTQVFQIAKLPTCLCYCAKKRIYEETNSSVIFLRTHCIPHGAKAPSWPESLQYRGFTITYHTRYDSSGRVISPTRRQPYNTQHSQERDIDASGGIRTRNPSKRAAADLRLRPHSHRDRL